MKPDTPTAPQPEVMLDIETLGLAPGCVILSIGAVGEHGEFDTAIDIASCLEAGLTIEAGTLEWWLQQHGPRRDHMVDQLPLGAALDKLTAWLPKNALIWSKGPSFDVAILEAAYRTVRRPAPWHFRNLRDLRTALAILPKPEDLPPNRRPHDALSDARYQWKQLQCARAMAVDSYDD